MTKDEIEKKQAMDLSTNAWLREIAIQLALLNEHHRKQPKAAK